MKKKLFLPILFISTLMYAKETNPLGKKYQEADTPRVCCKKRLLSTRSLLSIKEDYRNDLGYAGFDYFRYLEGEGLEKWDSSFSSNGSMLNIKMLPIKKAYR